SAFSLFDAGLAKPKANSTKYTRRLRIVLLPSLFNLMCCAMLHKNRTYKGCSTHKCIAILLMNANI
ncbi:MAG TPA: hypothetical protein PKL43_08425, partial [Bacteroidales bacterium]|nr:hypothetical protein [Bacteroidales bacterium]